MPPRADWDVVVVGLGAMGGLALWRLACRRGVRVVGVEQFEPGHDRGASHGESRIFRTAYMEGESYVPLMRRARRLWAELEQETGTALAVRTGCLSIGPAGSELVDGALRSAAAHGLAYDLLDAAALRRRYPQHADLPPGAVGLYEPDAGLLRPELAVRRAVAAAAARGAAVLTGTRVRAVDTAAGAVRVRLDTGDLVARRAVVAAGGWSGRLLPGLAPRLRVVRRVQGWFPPGDPAGFAPDRFPVFLRGAGRSIWYGLPDPDGGADGGAGPDGGAVKVAVHHWPGVDEPVDPDAGPRPPGPRDAALLAGLVRTALPGLGAEPVRMAACTYTLTPDEHFIVGPRSDLPGVTVLAGFSGHGFKFAPVIGETAAAAALADPAGPPVPLFDPHRFDGR